MTTHQPAFTMQGGKADINEEILKAPSRAFFVAFFTLKKETSKLGGVKMYNETTRIKGGSSFADAMLRSGASSDSYARIMMKRKLDKEWGENAPYTYHSSGDFFIIAFEGVPVAIRDFQFVEMKRSESVHAFEEWVMEIIRR